MFLLQEKILFNRLEILKKMPHGDAFCFLDAVTEIDTQKYKKIKGFTLIRPNFFIGHFKKTLIFPKVYKEEAIAQLGAFLLRSQQKYHDYIPIFSGESYAKEHDMVLPNDKMEIEFELLDFDYHRKGVARGKAFVQGKLVHELAFDFVIMKEEVLDKLIQKKSLSRRQTCSNSWKFWMFLDQEDRHLFLSDKDIKELQIHLETCFHCQCEYKKMMQVDRELALSFQDWANNFN